MAYPRASPLPLKPKDLPTIWIGSATEDRKSGGRFVLVNNLPLLMPWLPAIEFDQDSFELDFGAVNFPRTGSFERSGVITSFNGLLESPVEFQHERNISAIYIGTPPSGNVSYCDRSSRRRWSEVAAAAAQKKANGGE